jgi:hypothetical protein
MQKVQSYLYPNRVILIANLAGFTVENTIVYAKTVKIYNGIDNTIEFDIQNADQKRIDLSTMSNIELNVMDMSGNALPESPYIVTPTAIKGIATVTIPSDDILDLADQHLRYSVTAVSGGKDVILYCDSRFSAVGTIQLIGNAMPKIRDEMVYDKFVGEINYMGNVIDHTPAIPCKFYEAVPVEVMDFEIYLDRFIGTVYVEATTDMTISVDSFKKATCIQTFSTAVRSTQILTFNNVDVGVYNYFRISWEYPDVWQQNGAQDPYTVYGRVTKVIAIS